MSELTDFGGMLESSLATGSKANEEDLEQL